MATRAHARMACPEQKTSESGDQESTEGLKNGTSLEDSDDSSGGTNVLVKNRVASSAAGNQQHRDMTMDSFQDGGLQPNSRPASASAEGNFPAPMDNRSRMDYQAFNQSSEDFRNNQDNYNHGGVDVNYRGSYGGGGDQQHGGNSSDVQTNSQPNKMYPQYNQPQMRPGYPQGPRNVGMGPQQRPPMASYPGNNSQQQRFLSGPSLSQQTGPTPTLNQLLQAPNSLQRYHNNYDYGAQGLHKNMGDSNQGPQYQSPNNSSWGNMRGSSSYPQQITSSMYRNQGGNDPSMKRPYPSAGGPAPAPGGQYQYHPYRPPAANQPYPPQQQGAQQQYPQHGPSQQQPPAPMSSGSPYDPRTPSGAYGSQPPPSGPQPPQQQPTPPQQHPPSSQSPAISTPPAQQPPPQQQTQPPAQQPPPQQDAGSGTEDAPTEPLPGNTTPGLRNPATPPHPGVSPHRPTPSPAPSPSMSPALGQQPNIPMPPRPSSNQSENSGQTQMTQPSLSTQGYGQQMAPPAMYGNKIHQNMMGSASPHMPPYSPQPTGHYPQGGFHRPPGAMPMHNYGNQAQNNYPGPVSGGTPYPSQPSMPPHRMPSHAGAPQANYGSSPSGAGYNNSQYPGSGPPGPGYNMMPPPNQYPKSSAMPPPTGGAQAAAQAAVIAAAASSGGTSRQPPMYLRQHLQQKMYGNSYNSALSPVPPQGPNAGQDSPMPPPASTPSSQPMNVGQTSMPQLGSLGNAASCDGPVPASMVPAGFTQTSAPSISVPPSTVSQSICSPVQSSVTASSPSVPEMMQSQQGRNSMSGPPPVMDEGSQASNASASSSLPEERVETPKPNKPTISHPPTPNTLPSPGAASMSSFHDEFESVSSPSWPRTPASPVINNQTYDHHPIKRPDGMLKLYDMSDDPDRRLFLDKLIMYQEERGTPLSQCPTISKQPLDLYRLYLAAKERGGFVEVMKGKMWKEIAGLIGIGASSSAAYTLRKQYIKHLLPFECKYDRGGIDPGPLISSLESNSRKKNAKNAVYGNQDAYPPQGGQMMDGYPPYQGGYPPNPGLMSASEYPASGHHPSYQDSMHYPSVNHSSSEGAMDPFSDEMQGPQYQPRHSSGEGYGYTPSNANSGMPPYSGNQPNVPSGSFGYTSGQQEPYGDQYSNTMPPPASEQSYGNRNMVPDPYAPPPGGYPPNRTVGPVNSSQYPPYQGPCDQESRYDQPSSQSPMMRAPAPSSSVIGPPPQDPSSPYPPHRYPSQPVGARDSVPPQSMGSYQGRAPMGPSQYPGPNSQTSGQSPYPQPQQDSYRGSEFQPQMSRLQSTLIQRLLPKNQSAQNYPSNQQGMYSQSMPPPNKVAPPSSIPGNMYQRDMYAMGPKRHNEYGKPHGTGQDQYHMGNYPPQSQGPYPDRSQYPYRPTHNAPSQTQGPPQQGWPRDNRPYSAGQGQYPHGQRDNWDITRHGDGPPQPGGPAWSRYGPQSEPYSPHMGPSMGPKMAMNRGYNSPNKMTQHGVGPPPQYSSQSQRKEVIFPPDTVEAVAPLITKRRRLLSKDIAPIEAWRIMMSLKSGLLCETTWALDVLSILICDDATVLYFGLNHLPGLLEVLMDHYRRCLNLMFDLLGDLEVGFILDPGEGCVKERNKKWYELDSDLVKEEVPSGGASNFLNGDKVVFLDSVNYTYKTRCKKVVRTEEEEALFLFDPDDIKFPEVRPVSPSHKRAAASQDLEDESYNRDEPSLCTISDAQDSLARRCICISSILRNLSFVPGNDTEMSKHSGFLLVMGKLLLLQHVHSTRKPPQRHYDRDEEGESTSIADSCSSLNSEHEWWWDMLHIVRENTLVTLANITGQLDLAPFPEEISFPLLDGLMHWVTCPSSYAQDPLPTQPSHSVLSPQRLSLEALCKLSVLESNVDLMMATPPWERIDRFFSLLSKWLSRNEDQVLREFSVVLLSNLSQADSSMARAIALQGTCIPLLITFVEQAEQSALQVANSQGINALRENPELMGTTLDMVRRAAGTLRCLARVPSNRTLFLQHQQRLLALVMSQILDQGVASIIADVLFECSQEYTDEPPGAGDKESDEMEVET